MARTHLQVCFLIAICSASLGRAFTAQWRQVKPSETGAARAQNNAPHWVSRPPPTPSTLLRVFLPGTFGTPGSCSHLLNAVAGSGEPTIGLSYGFLTLPDASRNRACATKSGSDAVAQCLENQHADALWGGGREKSLWPEVAVSDSVSGRLGLLLAYLDQNFPEEGWKRFLDSSREPQEPKWKLILVGGHSQGAGHAGYLAQTTYLAGAALLSGPQDECIGCPNDGKGLLWVDRNWTTRHVTAAKHARESATSVIGQNWRFMARQLGWPGEPVDVGTARGPLPYGALVSHVSPSKMFIPRPFHVSMAEDLATPMVRSGIWDEMALYGVSLWPSLFVGPNASTAIMI